jgi:hypothetical protein
MKTLLVLLLTCFIYVANAQAPTAAAYEDYKTVNIKRGKKLITKKYHKSNGRIASKVVGVDMQPPRTVNIYSNWDEAGKLISKRKVIAFTGYAGTNRKIVWDYVLNGKPCLKRSLIGIK